YGMPGVRVDGLDVRAVYEAAGELIARARRGEGPSLLVAEAYRHEGHYYGDPRKYQTKDQIEGWKAKYDPIVDARKWIVDGKVATAAELDAIDDAVVEEAKKAVAFAEASPIATPIKLPGDVYASH
ncbi:MAG TPA: thiamine pyrophosphate-dependent enzyme, partial [Candidatus Limnocylindria bacterium]|nr:thiamine pyrophosphate-dependent enzyme [Candidatus Limnocylindria bacterium]